MASRHHHLVPFLFILLLVIAAGCGGGDDGGTAPGDPPMTAEEVRTTVVAPLDSLGELLDDLIAVSQDTMAAVDSVAAVLARDPAVTWVRTSDQGLTVQYDSGIRGAILVDPMDLFDAEDPPAPTPPGKSAALTTESKAIFLNPHNFQRAPLATEVMDNYDRLLWSAGFSPLVYLLDFDAGLEAFRHLDDYRIVHFYSHGLPWPSSSDIQEVYLLTGEGWDDDLYRTYWHDIHDGDLPLIKIPSWYPMFCVSPRFIARYNDFSGSGTLVYGGFCYSFLGSWPEVITGEAHAAGYVGFDWSVVSEWNADWNMSLMNHLLDREATPSWTPLLWLASGDYPTSFWSDLLDRRVHVCYAGDPRLTLVTPLECVDTRFEEPWDGYLQVQVEVYRHEAPVDSIRVVYGYRKLYCEGETSSIGPWTGWTTPAGHYWGGYVGQMHVENEQDMFVAWATVEGVTREVALPASALAGTGLWTPAPAAIRFDFP